MSGGEREIGSDDRLAPVIPLFGDRGVTGSVGPDRLVDESTNLPESRPVERENSDADTSATWHSSWIDDIRPDPGDRAASGAMESESLDGPRDRAEKSLLKKLRTRSLSVREARAAIVAHDLAADAVEDIVTGFLRRGYLDDAALAEQLIHSGVDRKGQGRQAIAQTLAKRGIPRDVADAALASLPDDDLDRALEYARSKARSLRDLEHEVALRRLTGQLARRGYPGSVALTAAKTALGEHGRRSGVRFE